MKEADTRDVQTKSPDSRMCFCLNTMGYVDFESQIKIVAQAGWKAVGIAMVQLEAYLATGKTVEEARTLLEDNDICPVEILAFRDWIGKKGKAQLTMLDLFRKYSTISRKLGHPILLASTLCQEGFDDSLASENFKEICRIAAEDENQVGLEFLPYSPVDTLKKGWDIVKAIDPPNGGIIFDFFHYLKGTPLLKELEEVPVDKIYDIHVDDLRDSNPEEDLTSLSRNYRVFPGEGDFIFGDVLENLSKRGYSRYYSLEVLNKDFSREDPLDLAYRAKRSLEGLLKDHTQKR